jgi:hypothetical protein
MRVRLLYCCPRCGSLLFRPSITRKYRDSFLGSIGVHAQRCYICRLRFYLFKPVRLRGFLTVLNRPVAAFQRGPLGGMDPAPGAVRNRPLVSGELFRSDRF